MILFDFILYNVGGGIMTEKIKHFLQCRDVVIPGLLFLNFKKIGLSCEELVFVVYIINNGFIFNPKKISEDLGLSLSDVMGYVDNLSSKGLIKLEIKKVGSVRNEFISLDLLYDKLSCLLIDTEESPKKSSIYDVFESEFGRTISPIEYEIIGAWLDNGTSEETIILALKEATYNGVSNLRYIDKIISEWAKKGIKTEEDVMKSRMNFNKRKEIKDNKSNDILNYDWLNDE